MQVFDKSLYCAFESLPRYCQKIGNKNPFHSKNTCELDNDHCYKQIDKRIKAEVQISADNVKKNSIKTPVNSVKLQKAALKKTGLPKPLSKATKKSQLRQIKPVLKVMLHHLEKFLQ